MKFIEESRERTQLLWTFVTERHSTKRSQLREPLVRTRVLAIVSDDAEFVRNEAKGRSGRPHQNRSRGRNAANEPNLGKAEG
jgi:hypothetical protein